MDRFIGKQQTNLHAEVTFLKSNMDRFIALVSFQDGFSSTSFKIQYG